MLVTPTTSHHNTKEVPELVMASLTDSTDNCTWGMTHVLWSKKVPTTTTMPTVQWQDLNTECPPTTVLESQHILAHFGTLGTYSCSVGKLVIVTDLGILVNSRHMSSS